MAQTGFTPIQLYSSSTPTNAPSASNLTNDTKGSELAINIADKNLFFKDSTNAVNTVPIRQSGTSSNGWLSSTDWNTFNNKQPAGAYVTSVTGTAPVVSSGGTTPAISMAAATTSVNGYLTSTDWNTFNGKQAALVSGTNIKTVNGTTLLGSGDLGTIGVAYGGTGLTSLTAGYIPFGAGTSAFGNSANLFWDSGNTRLGVGTNAPNATIRVIGASGGVQFGAGTSGNAVFINAFDSNPIYMTASASNSTSFGIGSASNIPFFFMSNNTERVRVHTSGGVSIGNTTDPGAGCLNVNDKIVSRGSNGYINTYTGLQSWATGGSTDAIAIKNTNTTNCGGLVCWNSSGTVVGSITFDNTSTAFNTSSDYRLKKNVELLKNGLNTIKQLKPVTYQWKLDDSEGEGFIAHELAETIPKAVVGQKDAVNVDGSIKPQGIDQAKIIPYLVAALQELNDKFEQYVATHP